MKEPYPQLKASQKRILEKEEMKEKIPTLDINNARQNHPELIVRDLQHLVPAPQIREVLKYRGVNKWFRVRRLLIQLKAFWKTEINQLEAHRRIAKERKDWKTYHQLKGYIKALTDCRQQIRALCHSPRDIDFPKSPRDFGIKCDLPADFPKRPHKRWFWKRNSLKQEGED